MDENVREPRGTLHPQPLLARAGWTDLCGRWGFAHDDDDIGLVEHWQGRADVFTRSIDVPFPPEAPASGIGATGYHPVVWYRRAVADPRPRPRERVILHFGAVDYRARVWVNSRLVAFHEGGQTPFSADVTTALDPGGEQVIVVRAEDLPCDLAQPRGKQDWQREPHVIWYQRTTGIWQPVWLETVSADHIAAIEWTTDPDRLALAVHVTLQRATARPLRLRMRLTLREQTIAEEQAAVYGSDVQREIVLDHAALEAFDLEQLLWSPEHPNLIEAVLTLVDDGVVTDEVHSYTGLRSVGVRDGHFLLNGQPYYLRLVLEQGYWPATHLAAADETALAHDVELAKQLGFNGLRIHQKVEDPRFLYYCDRLGMLVWGEMANAYVFSSTAVRRLASEWTAVVERDASHPCIIAWVPINESWGVPHLVSQARERHFVQALYHLTKSLDSTRPVMGNEGWEHVASDMLGVHDYASEGRCCGGATATRRLSPAHWQHLSAISGFWCSMVARRRTDPL